MVIKKITLLSLALLFFIPSFAMDDGTDGFGQYRSLIAQATIPTSTPPRTSLTSLQNTAAQAAGDGTNLREQYGNAKKSGRSAEALHADSERLRKLNTPETSASTSTYLQTTANNVATQAFARELMDAQTPLGLLSSQRLPLHQSAGGSSETPPAPTTPVSSRPTPLGASGATPLCPQPLTAMSPIGLQPTGDGSEIQGAFPDEPSPLPSPTNERVQTVADNNNPEETIPSVLDVLKDNLTNWKWSPATYTAGAVIAHRLSKSVQSPRFSQILRGVKYLSGAVAVATAAYTGYEAWHPMNSRLADIRRKEAHLHRQRFSNNSPLSRSER